MSPSYVVLSGLHFLLTVFARQSLWQDSKKQLIVVLHSAVSIGVVVVVVVVVVSVDSSKTLTMFLTFAATSLKSLEINRSAHTVLQKYVHLRSGKDEFIAVVSRKHLIRIERV